MREHGTHACYVWGSESGSVRGRGCRCEPCRLAASVAQRNRRRQAEPPYVSAGPARQHLKWLGDQGIGPKSIAEVSGVSHGCISKILYGDYGRRMPPSKRVRRETADKLLAVKPSDFTNASKEPAGPILALVERLVAAGVPKVRIAECLGQTGPGLQLGKQYVTRRHATAIRKMVADLDAGLFVTVKRDRHGGEKRIAPKGKPIELRTVDSYLVLKLAEALEQRIDSRDWRSKSACAGKPTWMFFPSRGDYLAVAAAKKVCAWCPVRPQCLETHLHERDGIFGGMSSKERRVEITRRRIETYEEVAA